MEKINIEDYDYDLPEDRIAQYPVNERDMSQLLILRKNNISKDIFRNIDAYVPEGSLLVFNNTKVIRARLLFKKPTGASIEVLCLEPVAPFEYELSFGSLEPVEWNCIIGNLKKWKEGKLSLIFTSGARQCNLFAEKIYSEGETVRVKFSWDLKGSSFGEIIEAAGHIPLPPYLNREDEDSDNLRYQTVYSSVKGSVAAPTAGLHFTNKIIERLKKNGAKLAELTLHVGAGTFQPVKTKIIEEHEMHCEHFIITAETLRLIINNIGSIIAVGTTSVRTLETLYWLGVKLAGNRDNTLNEFYLDQWDAYNMRPFISPKESLENLLIMMIKNNISSLRARTSIMIIPGYEFRIIDGLITNFHQPKSTLLLLISALIGEKWKEVYNFAIENNFRFLSYGDSSILLRQEAVLNTKSINRKDR